MSGEGPESAWFRAFSCLQYGARKALCGPVGDLEKVVVEFISALLHGVRRKNRHSSFWLKRVADAGLTSEKPAGKFEKLLRSDPRWFLLVVVPGVSVV